MEALDPAFALRPDLRKYRPIRGVEAGNRHVAADQPRADLDRSSGAMEPRHPPAGRGESPRPLCAVDADCSRWLQCKWADSVPAGVGKWSWRWSAAVCGASRPSTAGDRSRRLCETSSSATTVHCGRAGGVPAAEQLSPKTTVCAQNPLWEGKMVTPLAI